MLTPRERHQAKKDAWLAKKEEAKRQHPEWFQATNPKKPASRLPDKAVPLYKPEKLGQTPDTWPIQRYRKKVRRAS